MGTTRMLDPEIKQLKARMELIESQWIACERKLDIMIKKYDGVTDLLQKNRMFLE